MSIRSETIKKLQYKRKSIDETRVAKILSVKIITIKQHTGVLTQNSEDYL